MLVLYGIVGALFSYCVSLAVTSPLAAFALSAGYQVVMFVVRLVIQRLCYLHPLCTDELSQLYVAAYLLTLTYAKTSDAGRDLTLIRTSM